MPKELFIERRFSRDSKEMIAQANVIIDVVPTRVGANRDARAPAVEAVTSRGKKMTMCEDSNCDSECVRRTQCIHCGLFVCRWCWHHVHRCEPGHSPLDCVQRKLIRSQGKHFLDKVREITLAARRG